MIKYIYPIGNIRLAEIYFKEIKKILSENLSVLDIGCGDGIINQFKGEFNQYEGIDLGTGNYKEMEDNNVSYIRNSNQIEIEVQKRKFNLGLLINVIEHTETFTDLFEVVLKSSEKYVFVALPNEANIHNRLDFLLTGRIRSHDLRMYGTHLNLRHLWLIKPCFAEVILTRIAEAEGYHVLKKLSVTSLPNTYWKRILYRLCLKFLSKSITTRNFGILFVRKNT